MNAEQFDQQIAYAFLRFVFGLNICFHGVSRLFSDHAAFLAYLNQSMAHAVLIPKVSISILAALLPWAEGITGLFILLGLLTRPALMAGFTIMIVLVAGATLAQDWNAAGLQLIYCLIYFVLLTYRDRNQFSLDGLLRRS